MPHGDPDNSAGMSRASSLYGESLAHAILLLTHELHALRVEREHEHTWHKSHAALATKADLAALQHEILMKLSDIKTQVAASAARSKEAFAELGKAVAELRKQIDDLKESAVNPDISDQAFLSDLDDIKRNVDDLAEIIPDGPVTPTPTPEEGVPVEGTPESLRSAPAPEGQRVKGSLQKQPAKPTQ